MRVSLGLRVLGLVGSINLAVFGAGLYFLSDELSLAQQVEQQRFAERIIYNLTTSISPDGELRVAQILKYPSWDVVTDAIIVDRNPAGVSLNPVGSLSRGVLFDRALIDQDLARAMAGRTTVASAAGLALPVVDSTGNLWGGCWVSFEGEGAKSPAWLGLLPWFATSTFLLFFGTFGVLRRYVLRPVGALASGVRQIRSGNFEVPIAAPRHSDELTDLIGTFNQMASDVRGFHEYLENEADAAKEKAYRAEAAALRQRRLAAMGELAAGIAHEINNPLGGMLNAVEVLERPETTAEKRQRYQELLRDGLERIQGTVSRLLRFTPRTGELAPLDLAEPVRDAVALIRHRAADQGVLLAVDLAPQVCQVMGKRSELGQAVLNLLVNALDAVEDAAAEALKRGDGSGRRARIDVQLKAEGESYVLSVLDNGPGVPEDQLDRVVNLFYTTKEVGRGTGLGLALVHNVIAQHGGSVELLNREDGGLRVDLVIAALGKGSEQA